MTITKEQCKDLLRPFGPEDIEFIPKGGLEFAFVSHPACTRRLIEVFGGDWSFRIVDTKFTPKQVAVLGELTCSGSVRMQWAAQDVIRDDLDDSLKGAGSRALRKCASLFGVALHLWEDKLKPEDVKRAKAPISKGQLKRIVELQKNLEWDKAALFAAAGGNPRELNTFNADRLIESMDKSLRERGALEKEKVA